MSGCGSGLALPPVAHGGGEILEPQQAAIGADARPDKVVSEANPRERWKLVGDERLELPTSSV